MMNDTGITILIATYNRPQMLAACIESLLKQSSAVVSYEILVLDQSDIKHKLPAIINSDQRVRVIHCSFKNKSRALNLGVTCSRNDIFAVIDDDCIASQDWIERIYEEIQCHPDQIVTGRVLAGNREEGAVLSRLHDGQEGYATYEKGAITPIFVLSGCNFAFYRNIYDHIGPFDTNFGPGSLFRSSDDNEWSYRALSHGIRVLYSPKVIIYHRSWRDTHADSKLMRDYGYAAGAFFALLWRKSKKDFLYHVRKLVRWLLASILFSFQVVEIKNHIAYAVHGISGFYVYYRFSSR